MKITTKIQPMNQKVSFVDKKGSKVIAEVEITFRNKYPEFSMCGHFENSSGQCFDRVKPTKIQKELLEFWKKWHLKKINAKAVTELKGIINRIVEAEDLRRNKEPDLSKMMDQDLVDHIESITLFTGRDAKLCGALVRIFDLSVADLDGIEINGTRVTVQGTDYIACNDSEMEVEYEEALEHLLEECILPEAKLGNNERYFNRQLWLEDAKNNGDRVNELNRYNGSKESAKINGTYYFAYQQ